MLVCNAGYSPDPASGNLARCVSSVVTTPNPCISDPGCTAPVVAASTCGRTGAMVATAPSAKLSNGDICEVTCVPPLVSRGSLVCMSPTLEGVSSCVDPDTVMVPVTHVSGSFTMDLSAEPTEAHIRASLADAIDDISLSDIHSVSVTPTTRRLQEGLLYPRRLGTNYLIDYVIAVPVGTQASALVGSMGSLSGAGSVVQQAFVNSMQTTASITVNSIATVIAPRSFSTVKAMEPQIVTNTVTVTEEVEKIVEVPGVPVPVPGPVTLLTKIVNNTVPVPVPTPSEADDNMGMMVGAVLGTFFVTLCLVGGAVCIRQRKGKKNGSSDNSWRQPPQIAAGRYPGIKNDGSGDPEASNPVDSLREAASEASDAPGAEQVDYSVVEGEDEDRLAGYVAGDIVVAAKNLTGGGRVLVYKNVKGMILGPAGAKGEIAVRFDERADLDGQPDTVHVMPNEIKAHPDFTKEQRQLVELPTE